MRTITNLTPQEIEQLRQAVRDETSRPVQRRCQCILYSYYGLSVSELMDIFNVNRRSIYTWLNRWEKDGLQGLMDKPGRGNKPKLKIHHQPHLDAVRQALAAFPTSTNQALNQVNQQLSKPISQATLRRFVKKLDASA